MGLLRQNNVTLHGERIVLRPLSENDWEILTKWNNDPEILYFVELDGVSTRSPERVQSMYQSVSQTAFCFIIEFDGRPIGECWLQKMNLDRILRQCPEKDCRRIDLMIGEKLLWNKGLGTETIRVLIKFGFEKEKADVIFGIVGGHNPRSLRVFQKAGFELCGTTDMPKGAKSPHSYDLVLTRETYKRRHNTMNS